MDAIDGKREVAGLEALGPFIFPVSGRNLERFHEKGRDHKTPTRLLQHDPVPHQSSFCDGAISTWQR